MWGWSVGSIKYVGAWCGKRAGVATLTIVVVLVHAGGYGEHVAVEDDVLNTHTYTHMAKKNTQRSQRPVHVGNRFDWYKQRVIQSQYTGMHTPIPRSEPSGKTCRVVVVFEETQT